MRLGDGDFNYYLCSRMACESFLSPGAVAVAYTNTHETERCSNTSTVEMPAIIDDSLAVTP